MSTSYDLEAIARELKRAQDNTVQIEPLTARFTDFDLAAAYAVAGRISELRRMEGFAPVGRKIGFTNTSLWPIYDVHLPIWGCMYDRTVVQLDGCAARCSLRGLTEPRIEPEIVFRLRSAPAPGTDALGLLRAIEWVAHGFEIVQSHFPGWKFRAPDTVADNGLHGRLFVGPPQPVAVLGPDLPAALESFSLSLACNGAAREVGRGSNVLGSPLSALAHLVAVLADQPGCELRAGEIVTTGTITNAYPVAAGETWKTEIDGIALPGLEIAFIA